MSLAIARQSSIQCTTQTQVSHGLQYGGDHEVYFQLSQVRHPCIGYSTFIKAVKEFKETGITVTQFLDETKHDIANVLLENKASWHKSCRDNYNSTKLQRAKQKRKQADVEEKEKGCEAYGSETAKSSPKKSRRSLTPFDPKILQCFFREKNDLQATFVSYFYPGIGLESQRMCHSFQ